MSRDKQAHSVIKNIEFDLQDWLLGRFLRSVYELEDIYKQTDENLIQDILGC
jgi:hypothetical protein